VYNPVPLGEIVPYIDWTPFFHAWELRGIYPKIFEQEGVGPKAKELFDDGRKLLDQIVRERLLEARAVIGFFPANSVLEDIESTRIITAFAHDISHLAAAASERQSGTQFCGGGFYCPRESGKLDYLGVFAVTAGLHIEPLVKSLRKITTTTTL